MKSTRGALVPLSHLCDASETVLTVLSHDNGALPIAQHPILLNRRRAIRRTLSFRCLCQGQFRSVEGHVRRTSRWTRQWVIGNSAASPRQRRCQCLRPRRSAFAFQAQGILQKGNLVLLPGVRPAYMTSSLSTRLSTKCC